MTTAERVEAAFDQVQLAKLLGLARGAVLVGGQAVAFWASFLNVPVPPALGSYVTKDSDFLGDREDVARMASGMQGAALYPHQRALTALAGQVKIDLSEHRYLNIDVLHKIVGFDDSDAVRKRAEERFLGEVRFRVMHPVDCLKSRLENLRKLAEKRNEAGAAQAELAVRVVRRYLETVLEEGNERLALRAAESVAKMAVEPAGALVFRSYGIDVLDAVPVKRISNKKFLDVRWPQIRAQAEGRRRPKS
ncbi:MAG: hypothetical protein HY017_33260 [Betaproteobacteria bacterium]|nr:hypothetical protein [Betaproteobacteria bacterium]